jgi:hypothetical protein
MIFVFGSLIPFCVTEGYGLESVLQVTETFSASIVYMAYFFCLFKNIISSKVIMLYI